MAKLKKDQLSKVEIPAGEHAVIPLFSILPDPNQPRKHFDEAKLQELAASIKSIGVTQNVIVHQNDANGYTLIAGERRYRASILAGKEDIPAIIYPPLPEDVVKEIQIAENLHRQDMNAMEESDAFFDLTKRGMTTAADIAKRINKSEGYVYDRLALQNCIEHVQEMLRNGSLPITHGKQFAKLNINDQQELWDVLIEDGAMVGLSDLKDKIRNRFSMVLDNAPFDLEDASLVAKAGACKNCPKRSGCNGLLFDDVSSKDICFDKTCYDSKVAAHIEAGLMNLREEGKTVHRIISQYTHETPAGVLMLGHYDVCEDGEEPEAYGIVMRSGYKVNNVEVGTVVGIKYTSSGRVFLGLPIGEQSDNEDEEEDTDSESSANSTNSRPGWEKHNEAFCCRLASILIEKFKTDPASIRLKDLELKIITDSFNRIDEDLFKRIWEMAGWKIVVDEEDDDSINFAATIAVVYNSMEYGSAFLLDLSEQLSQCDNFRWERCDIPNIMEECPNLHVDIAAEMDAYEQETGYKFND